MLFGRSFERALAAYFLRQDAAETLFREWQPCRNQEPHYSGNDTWDRMLDQGIQLLDRFCQADRVRIRRPGRPLQSEFTRRLSAADQIAAFVDRIGHLH